MQVHRPRASPTLGSWLEMQNSGPTQDTMNHNLPCDHSPACHGCVRSTVLVTALFLPFHLCGVDKACVDWSATRGTGENDPERQSESKQLHWLRTHTTDSYVCMTVPGSIGGSTKIAESSVSCSKHPRKIMALMRKSGVSVFSGIHE